MSVILAGGLFAALSLIALRSPADDVETNTFWPVLVNVFETAESATAGQDAAGLARRPELERLLSSRPVPDGSPPAATVWETDLEGIVLHIGEARPFDDPMAGEPTGIAYNPLDGHYFFTSRDVGFVGEVDPGPDARLGTADDLVRSFELPGLQYAAVASRRCACLTSIPW